MPPIRDAAARVRAVVPTPPPLHPRWRDIVRYAWSMRVHFLAIVLDAAYGGWTLFADSPPIPLKWFAAVQVALHVSAGAAQLFAQKNLTGGDDA